jgi:hypothetical protein
MCGSHGTLISPKHICAFWQMHTHHASTRLEYSWRNQQSLQTAISVPCESVDELDQELIASKSDTVKHCTSCCRLTRAVFLLNVY